jgi:glyoxylase-like metal-dependent hydrolase (beta-lactamase superfamily II)
VLTQVADGVLVHRSALLENNTVVVEGRAGVLLVDPGITGDELACLADDLRRSGRPVAAGFATHPDWDHVLWHPELGDAPRYGTARCAARLRELLSDADWRTGVSEGLPPEIADGGAAGRVRPRHRSAARNGAGPLGRACRADHRAPGARPGTCGAADRGPPRPGGRERARGRGSPTQES